MMQVRKSSYSDGRPKKISQISMKDRVVLITGASSGIGSACAWAFAEQGAKLILIARREERLVSLERELKAAYPSLLVHHVVLSVNDYDMIAKLPSSLPETFAKVDILVNNAGLALRVDSVEENNISDAATVINTNVLGVIVFCSAFLPGMKERGQGHIINMGSCAGHYAYAKGSVYNASKYALRGYTEAARHDLAGTPIRVTHLSPGLVGNTEFSNVRLSDDLRAAAAVYQDIEALQPEDVADNVLYAATRPLHVQIAEIIMYANNQSGPRDIVRAGPSMGRVS